VLVGVSVQQQQARAVWARGTSLNPSTPHLQRRYVPLVQEAQHSGQHGARLGAAPAAMAVDGRLRQQRWPLTVWR
jgi:hypothetical protein